MTPKNKRATRDGLQRLISLGYDLQNIFTFDSVIKVYDYFYHAQSIISHPYTGDMHYNMICEKFNIDSTTGNWEDRATKLFF